MGNMPLDPSQILALQSLLEVLSGEKWVPVKQQTENSAQEVMQGLRELKDQIEGINYRLNFIEERHFVPSALRPPYNPALSFSLESED